MSPTSIPNASLSRSTSSSPICSRVRAFRRAASSKICSTRALSSPYFTGRLISSHRYAKSGVIVHRLVEHLVVGDGDDAPGELAAADPHRRRVALLLRRLAHFHDPSLHEAQIDDVAAH